jgi:hypothetical protein
MRSRLRGLPISTSACWIRLRNRSGRSLHPRALSPTTSITPQTVCPDPRTIDWHNGPSAPGFDYLHSRGQLSRRDGCGGNDLTLIKEVLRGELLESGLRTAQKGSLGGGIHGGKAPASQAQSSVSGDEIRQAGRV